jgi:hypothetical protein
MRSYLEIDNHSAKRSIRCVSLGRKDSSLWVPRAAAKRLPSPIL